MQAPEVPSTRVVIGTWRGTVVLPDLTARLELRLTADGKAFLNTEGGPSDTEGTGTWVQVDRNRFNFRLLERLPGPDGALMGWVSINQDAHRDEVGFQSTGISDVYDSQGVFVRSVRSTVSASLVTAS